MHRLPPVVLALALGALSPAGPAAAQHMNAPDSPCKTVGAGVAYANCLSAAAREADKALNATYRRILAALAAADRERLQRAERSWLRYRDDLCAAERDLYDGGTGASPAHAACVESETRVHADELRKAYWWRVEKTGR